MAWIESVKDVSAIASPFLLLGLAGLGALYKMERDRRRDVEARLNENKAKIYAAFIESYSGLFFKKTGGEKTVAEIEAVVHSTNDFARQALLYASDDVVRRFHKMYRLQLTPFEASEGPKAVRERIRAFADVVRAIRKELGHSNSTLDTDLVGGLLVTDYSPKS